MKKLNILLLLLFISFNSFSQNNNQTESQLERIITTRINDSIQIDLFFAEPVNPKTITSANIYINGKNINSNTKFTYNRDGTQVRFLIDYTDSFSLKLENIQTNTQKLITTDIIILNGATTWKKS